MTRTERTFYVVSGGYSLAGWFLGPVYPLFLLSRGLDLFQMNVVLATFFIAVFLFEVPTGAVADYFGRKISFIASCVVRMIAFGYYASAEGFIDCLIGELIDAIGITLASGALEAWAVDGIRKETNDDRPLDRIFARSITIGRGMMVIGGIVGGYVASIGFEYSWLCGAAGFGLTGLVSFFLMYSDRHEVSKRRTHARGSFLTTITSGLSAVRRSPVLIIMCLLNFAFFCGGAPAHITWQPRVEELTGQGVWLMGWLWALINLSTLLGSLLLPRMLNYWRREYVLTVTMAIRSVMLYIAASSSDITVVVAAFLLQEVGLGLIDPMMRAWTNEHTVAEQRATVLSVASMFGTLGGSFGLILIGLVARANGIPAAWVCSAAIFAVTAPGFLVLARVTRRTAPIEVRTAA